MRPWLACLLALWPAAGVAQGPDTGERGREPMHALAAGPVAPARFDASAAAPSMDVLRTPAGAFTASLLLPGAGQAALGLRRWIVYGAAEVALWALHLDAAADVRHFTTAYRDLAWESARLRTGPGERMVGTWGYYEAMGDYVASGAFDRSTATPGLQPELDPATYNGLVWELARGIYLPGGVADPASPEYELALAYYREHAAGPDFLWDWSGRLDDMDRYNGLIRDADSEARLRSTALGLVLANHLVAAVDALIVARLRTDAGVRLESRLTPTPGAPRWSVGFRITVPN